MNAKLTYLAMLIFLSLSCFAFADDKAVAASADGYQIIQSEVYGQYIEVIKDGNSISKIVPQYSDKIGEGSLIIPIYDHLVKRGSFEEQPKLFDDVTGDGNQDIVCLERPASFSNSPGHDMAIRTFSIIDGTVEENEPIFDSIGAMLHYDDFNKDGIFEIVNTDQERYFLYSREGFPISSYVWIFDPGYKLYYRASKMVNEE
jgi:hypothetical protein